MHNAALKAVGRNGVYLAFDVVDVAGALTGVRALGIKGLSVTIPHKEAVIPFLDQVDEAAQRIGAVNTVINHSGQLQGINTDALGAVKALNEVTDLNGAEVVILGAGGSARAVAVGVAEEGAVVHVANRTVARAEEVAALCGGSYSGLDDPGLLGDILVNTTSVGMAPHSDATPIAPEVVGRFKVVMDIVYSPLKTRLLAEAEAQGLTVVNGLKMLLYQAVAQFEAWTGLEAPIEVMATALQQAINSGAEAGKGPKDE